MVGVVGSSPIVPTKQTKKGSRKLPFFCVHEMPKLCGAGFIPADGGGRAAGFEISTPQAGIKPAPQGLFGLRVLCGAGFIPANGGGRAARFEISTPLAGVEPAPHGALGLRVLCGAGYNPAKGGGRASTFEISPPSSESRRATYRVQDSI